MWCHLHVIERPVALESESRRTLVEFACLLPLPRIIQPLNHQAQHKDVRTHWSQHKQTLRWCSSILTHSGTLQSFPFAQLVNFVLCGCAVSFEVESFQHGKAVSHFIAQGYKTSKFCCTLDYYGIGRNVSDVEISFGADFRLSLMRVHFHPNAYTHSYPRVTRTWLMRILWLWHSSIRSSSRFSRLFLHFIAKEYRVAKDLGHLVGIRTRT